MKRNSALQNSPPAAGCFSNMIPVRRSAHPSYEIKKVLFPYRQKNLLNQSFNMNFITAYCCTQKNLLSPEILYIHGRCSDFASSLEMPSQIAIQWLLFPRPLHSRGDCTGISPVSLLTLNLGLNDHLDYAVIYSYST